MSIVKISDELGIDIVINFEGIEEITEALNEAINIETGKKIFKIEAPTQYKFSTLRDMLKEIQEKIENIPKEREIIEIKEAVREKGEKIKPVIENLNEFVDVSPSGSNMLTEHAMRGLERILEAKFKERETEFTEINLDDESIRKVFIKLREKGYDEAKKLADELIGEDADTILKEMVKIKSDLNKRKRGGLLTPASMTALLEREQRRQRNIRINPLYEREALPTIEKFRKKVIEGIDESIKDFVSGDITTKEFESFIDGKMAEINETIKPLVERKVGLSYGRKEELKEVAKQTKEILNSFKSFVSNIPDEEKRKQSIQKMYDFMLKREVIPIDFTKMMGDMSKELTDTETVGKLVSLKFGDDMLDILLESMNNIVRDDKAQKFMRDTIEDGFKTISSTALIDTIAQVNDLIVTQLLSATNVREAAKLFRKEYLPNLKQIQKIFDSINVEDMEAIKTASQYAKSLTNLKNVKFEKLTPMFEAMSKISDSETGAIFGIVNEVERHKKDLAESIDLVQIQLGIVTTATELLKVKAIEGITEIKDVEQMANAAKRDVLLLDEKLREIFPRAERTDKTFELIEKVEKKIDKTSVSFEKFDETVAMVKKDLKSLTGQMKRAMTSLAKKADKTISELEGVGQ